MKVILSVSIIAAWLVAGCNRAKTPDHPADHPTDHLVDHPADLPVVYRNAAYDLTFYLPAGWQGYSVLVQSWDGDSYIPAQGAAAVTARGPIIVLRHPRWTTNAPYQDIPIMIFTRSQWDAEEAGKFFPYAGGAIEEMWHNEKYVFGLYSRYNFGDSVKEAKGADSIIERNRAANKMPKLHSK